MWRPNLHTLSAPTRSLHPLAMLYPKQILCPRNSDSMPINSLGILMFLLDAFLPSLPLSTKGRPGALRNAQHATLEHVRNALGGGGCSGGGQENGTEGVLLWDLGGGGK